MKAVYDIAQSAEWNCLNGPCFEGEIPVRENFPLKTKLWDFDLNSPIGIPAGPLFNSKFIKLYAALGFDVLVYKTVRSVPRLAHPVPNIVFVDAKDITEEQLGKAIYTIPETDNVEEMVITNSFGMNSLAPEEWQKDFDLAQRNLADGQLLIMSVTASPGTSGRDMKEDFVYTANLAKDAGAKVIELNFSCPNVKTGGEGSVYLDPDFSSEITAAVKKEIGDRKLVIKLGYYNDLHNLDDVLRANAKYVDGVAGINTISMDVYTPEGEQALPGEGRLKSGLCGKALKPFALKTIRAMAEMKKKNNYDFEIFGVGGLMKPEDLDEMLEAGAKVAMSGTAIMWNPMLARDWSLRK